MIIIPDTALFLRKFHILETNHELLWFYSKNFKGESEGSDLQERGDSTIIEDINKEGSFSC